MDRLLDAQEVCDLLKISKQTLYNWRYTGTGPRAIKLGNRIRYRVREVEKFLEAQSDPKPAA